jgi:protein SCO1/2
MLVYFGYTYCPDVCPTELQTMAAAVDRLGPDGAKVVPVFVTVDPQRDTPEVLADYVKLFSPRLTGLTGTPAEIASIAREYRVYYAKVTPKNGGDYLMDHSSFVYLIGPQGRLRALIHPGRSADEVAATIEAQIRKPG